MDSSDIFNTFYYRRINAENLEKEMQKITKIINVDLRVIIETSFRAGFSKGETIARADEGLMVRGKIVDKLFANTDLSDDEIFEIVGLGEDKWGEYINYLRKQYEEGRAKESKAEQVL